MNKVSQALDQPNCNKPSIISKQAYSILIITLVVLACSTILDHAAHDAVNESLSSALITFGSASLLDSVVSMFKSFEVSVGVASFDLGQMLNSISDMLDLFKHTMALALASLSLQKFLLITMSSKLFNALVLLSGIGLLATIWTGKLTPFKERATKVFKTLLIVRFAVIASVSLSLAADHLFIDESVKENEAQATELSQSISKKVENIASIQTNGEQEDKGFIDGMSDKWDSMKANVITPKDIIVNIMESIDNAMIKFINLMMLFVLKTIFLPILFLLAFKKFVVEAF
ncbi:hypothetical protein [Vibrio gigantis]|uniref:Uncharacterized protein n=1 Tax=Vibrio gigantis TaxID=296199 RepID=A0A5M9P050_9VIBR|nr:hypothetical protein [Vibrio gigantis]KAA8677702.1 hypothetical protein F4W18_09100 [Vibrio gigantis]